MTVCCGNYSNTNKYLLQTPRHTLHADLSVTEKGQIVDTYPLSYAGFTQVSQGLMAAEVLHGRQLSGLIGITSSS